MALFTWKDSYSVSVEKFDDEHKKLVSLINDIHDATCKGQARESLGKAIDFLVEYVDFHFSNEEKVFQEIGYPEYEQHKAIHDAFRKKVEDYQTKFKSGDHSFLVTDIVDSLIDWLINHIKGVDKKYSDYLNSKGIK